MYVRESSRQQLLEHTESTLLRYALAEWAIAPGSGGRWRPVATSTAATSGPPEEAIQSRFSWLPALAVPTGYTVCYAEKPRRLRHVGLVGAQPATKTAIFKHPSRK